MPVIDLPPPPEPAPEPVKEPEPEVEEEAAPEPPELARRRQLLRILIPDDNEAPISDDEPGVSPSWVVLVGALVLCGKVLK